MLSRIWLRGERRFWTRYSFEWWKNVPEKSNIHFREKKKKKRASIYPYTEHSHNSLRILFNTSSNSLLANYSFRQYYIISLIPWPGTKIPYKSDDRNVFIVWALGRMMKCVVQKRYSKPHSFLVSHLDTQTRYNKIQHNFAVESDFCHATLMKPFDVLRRCMACFLTLLAIPSLTRGLKNISFHTSVSSFLP